MFWVEATSHKRPEQIAVVLAGQFTSFAAAAGGGGRGGGGGGGGSQDLALEHPSPPFPSPPIGVLQAVIGQWHPLWVC